MQICLKSAGERHGGSNTVKPWGNRIMMPTIYTVKTQLLLWHTEKSQNQNETFLLTPERYTVRVSETREREREEKKCIYLLRDTSLPRKKARAYTQTNKKSESHLMLPMLKRDKVVYERGRGERGKYPFEQKYVCINLNNCDVSVRIGNWSTTWKGGGGGGKEGRRG